MVARIVPITRGPPMTFSGVSGVSIPKSFKQACTMVRNARSEPSLTLNTKVRPSASEQTFTASAPSFINKPGTCCIISVLWRPVPPTISGNARAASITSWWIGSVEIVIARIARAKPITESINNGAPQPSVEVKEMLSPANFSSSSLIATCSGCDCSK